MSGMKEAMSPIMMALGAGMIATGNPAGVGPLVGGMSGMTGGGSAMPGLMGADLGGAFKPGGPSGGGGMSMPGAGGGNPLSQMAPLIGPLSQMIGGGQQGPPPQGPPQMRPPGMPQGQPPPVPQMMPLLAGAPGGPPGAGGPPEQDILKQLMRKLGLGG